MFKSLVVAGLLVTTNVAFACGGKACSHCDDAGHTAAVEDISKAPGTHVALDVTGMKCGACSKKVTAALTAIEGVNAVSVNHETGKAEVAFDEGKTNTDAMITAIKALSFEASVAPKQG
ncbi:MAG: heavy-metal-associated domain-containing protein [Myxococcales bacterium]|nr:heavy-metal-associated domain-containing protein [Myxococcales bacterium]MCB9670156.1 heavy-metal-associated domain-containing protein [Alphaproteobacteria bacterium]MCB9693597.1 heavy-metal-associated domain-containing protein [Alphaproteobacteria bacterium]